MSDEQSPWMGCAAQDSAVVELSMGAFTREFSDQPNAWAAASATLLHQKPVRFELQGGEGYYLAPFDPNMIGQQPRAIIVGHLKLEELMPLAGPPALRADQPPAEILTPYRVHFMARIPCEIVVRAASEGDARRRAAQDFDTAAHRLLSTAHSNLQNWTPAPTDFEFVRAEAAQ